MGRRSRMDIPRIRRAMGRGESREALTASLPVPTDCREWAHGQGPVGPLFWPFVSWRGLAHGTQIEFALDSGSLAHDRFLPRR